MSKEGPDHAFGLTVYANSLEEAEKLRTIVVDSPQANQKIAREEGIDFPLWDIDANSGDLGKWEEGPMK